MVPYTFIQVPYTWGTMNIFKICRSEILRCRTLFQKLEVVVQWTSYVERLRSQRAELLKFVGVHSARSSMVPYTFSGGRKVMGLIN